MLTEDATWSMPPLPTWYRGLEAIRAFLTEWPLNLRWRRLPVRANGQLAVAGYLWGERERRYEAYGLEVLALRGAQIEAVTSFLTPDFSVPFGLPAHLPA